MCNHAVRQHSNWPCREKGCDEGIYYVGAQCTVIVSTLVIGKGRN